jgi:hypothetical protein
MTWWDVCPVCPVGPVFPLAETSWTAPLRSERPRERAVSTAPISGQAVVLRSGMAANRQVPVGFVRPQEAFEVERGPRQAAPCCCQAHAANGRLALRSGGEAQFEGPALNRKAHGLANANRRAGGCQHE